LPYALLAWIASSAGPARTVRIAACTWTTRPAAVFFVLCAGKIYCGTALFMK
jgi:hypothetical protein